MPATRCIGVALENHTTVFACYDRQTDLEVGPGEVRHVAVAEQQERRVAAQQRRRVDVQVPRSTLLCKRVGLSCSLHGQANTGLESRSDNGGYSTGGVPALCWGCIEIYRTTTAYANR